MSDADVRLVPMTRDQQEAIQAAFPAIFASPAIFAEQLVCLTRLLAAWDAAPANPAETVLRQIKAGPALQALCDGTGDEWLTGAILEALGFVVSSTETSTPDA